MRDGSETKSRIEAAALRLFVEKGITETSVRDIAAAAGITEGAIYRHFTSKSQLATDLYRINLAESTRELERLRNAQTSVKGQVEVMIRAFCSFFDRDPTLFSYLLLAQHVQMRKLTADTPHPFYVLLESIQRGMERGEIPKRNPVVVASMVIGLVLHVAVSRAYGRFDNSLTSQADTIVEAAWSVLSS